MTNHTRSGSFAARMITTDNAIRLCTFAFSVLQIAFYFFPLEPLFYMSIACVVYILAVSLFTMSSYNRRMIIMLLICAGALMAYTGANAMQWARGLGKNGLLIAFFTLAGLLRLPFEYDDYQSELKNVAKLYLTTALPFTLMIAVTTHIFAALIGFATFAIMYHLFSEISKLYGPEDMFISTLGRSYASSGFWGSSWVSVAMVVSEMRLAWYRVILVGMIMTAIAMGLNLLSIKLKLPRPAGGVPEPDSGTVVDWRRIRVMATLAFIIVAVTLTVNIITGWSLLAIVPLVSVSLPVIAALVQRKRPEFMRGVEVFVKNNLSKGRVNVCLFTAAGLLAHAMDISGVGELAPKLIPAAFQDKPYLLILSIILIIVVPGQLGIHPVATGTTLVAVITPSQIGLTIQQFAMCIICGWVISNMMSPFSAINLTLSGLSGKSSVHTGLKLNWRYGLICLFVFSGAIILLSPLLGSPSA